MFIKISGLEGGGGERKGGAYDSNNVEYLLIGNALSRRRVVFGV